MNLLVYARMHVCTYVCMYVCMYVCIAVPQGDVIPPFVLLAMGAVWGGEDRRLGVSIGVQSGQSESSLTVLVSSQ